MRSFLFSLSVGGAFLAIYYVFQIISEFYQTVDYTPDVMNSYKEVEQLKNHADFAVVQGFPIIEIMLLVLGIATYYIVRAIRARKPIV
ncbi:hypothetical protein [Paenibacillus aquistagni]|uniref:hypothetical protein n=1 Tax=Paenibacillus aquistagni TaxID=1852522 RepID=UPI00145A3382|nr:hypothetical protein [Paenibacillus aquistagni]NMM53908.1 hypothetical protein [Paenibacillus aquistagni]